MFSQSHSVGLFQLDFLLFHSLCFLEYREEVTKVKDVSFKYGIWFSFPDLEYKHCKTYDFQHEQSKIINQNLIEKYLILCLVK